MGPNPYASDFSLWWRAGKKSPKPYRNQKHFLLNIFGQKLVERKLPPPPPLTFYWTSFP